MTIVRGIKRRLHRDIVADPVLHGRVLNLYLNGEQYPHRVADYFPMAAVEDPALAERMRAHLRDEDRHVALYCRAIRSLAQPVLELPIEDVYNTVIRRRTPAVDIGGRSEPDARRLSLAHFFAHLHFLESRVAQSLDHHLDACAHATSPYPAKAVEVIRRDEGVHATYTREALFGLVPDRVAHDVLAIHRRAEAGANREFSARELRRLLCDEPTRFSRAGRVLYACSAALLAGGVHG